MIQCLPRVGVEYEPPVPASVVRRWQAELDLIAPRSDKVSWLYIGYVSGDWWEDNVVGETRAPGIGRWVIYQMKHRSHLGPMAETVLPDLLGPNPRTFGRWNARDKVFEQRRPCAVNRYQWEIFRQTQCYAQPYFVVQGTKGGHLRRYTPVQAKLSRLKGGRDEPPAIGELPYAEPDRRTFNALAQMDLLRACDLMIGFAERSPEQLEEREKAEVENMKEQVWRHLSSQLDSVLSDRVLLRTIGNRLPTGVSTTRRKVDPEKVHERFVTH